MKQLFFMLLAASWYSASAQASLTSLQPDSARRATQKFYFPATLFNDSAALYKALPQLAQQVAAAYSNPDRTDYFENLFRYQMLAQDYNAALASLDSERVLTSDNAAGIQFESYAYAKKRSPNDPALFNQAYTKRFQELFGKLSIGDKMYVASYFDSANLASVSNKRQQIITKLKALKTDSISLADAQELSNSYNSHIVYGAIVSLSTPFTNDPKLKPLFPVIKSYKWASVVPVDGIDEIPDPTLQYNLLMELTSGIKNKNDSAAVHDVNIGLGEVGRLMNLHAASGIPLKNINVVVVVHGRALRSLYTDAVYKKMYGIANPNTALLNELKAAGVKLIVCGQAMNFIGIERNQLIPGVKLSLTAQTVLSAYQLKHYVYYDLAVHND